MDSSQIIRLPNDVIERCKAHGQQRVEGYAIGRNCGSRALSSHGAEANADLQAFSMMGECAFCLWADVSIENLNWTGHSDPGFDLEINGYRFDVKTTGAGCHYLIWPVNKRHIFEGEPFDYLVLVKGRPPIFQIAGVISKEAFGRQHKVADEAHKLDAGTWFMHESELWRPQGVKTLVGWHPPQAERYDTMRGPRQ